MVCVLRLGSQFVRLYELSGQKVNFWAKFYPNCEYLSRFGFFGLVLEKVGRKVGKSRQPHKKPHQNRTACENVAKNVAKMSQNRGISLPKHPISWNMPCVACGVCGAGLWGLFVCRVAVVAGLRRFHVRREGEGGEGAWHGGLP